MLDYIIKEKLFIGQSKQEVLEQLGHPDSISVSGQEFLIYSLGSPPSFFASKKKRMIIRFHNNKAIKIAELEED